MIVQQTRMQRVREVHTLKKDKGGSGRGSGQRAKTLSMHAYDIRDRIQNVCGSTTYLKKKWTSHKCTTLLIISTWIYPFNQCLGQENIAGCLGGSFGWASDFGSGHDLLLCEFEPWVGLCAGSQLRAWNLFQILCLLFAPPPLALACSLSLKNKHTFKKMRISIKKKKEKYCQHSRGPLPTSWQWLPLPSTPEVTGLPPYLILLL